MIDLTINDMMYIIQCKNAAPCKDGFAPNY